MHDFCWAHKIVTKNPSRSNHLRDFDLLRLERIVNPAVLFVLFLLLLRLRRLRPTLLDRLLDLLLERLERLPRFFLSLPWHRLHAC